MVAGIRVNIRSRVKLALEAGLVSVKSLQVIIFSAYTHESGIMAC